MNWFGTILQRYFNKSINCCCKFSAAFDKGAIFIIIIFIKATQTTSLQSIMFLVTPRCHVSLHLIPHFPFTTTIWI